MRTYSFSEARQKFAEVLDAARSEDVFIQRRGGETFVVSVKRRAASPFDDVPVVDRGLVTTDDIIAAVRFSRSQPWRSQKKAKKS